MIPLSPRWCPIIITLLSSLHLGQLQKELTKKEKEDVEQKLKDHELIEEVLPKAPDRLIYLDYGNGTNIVKLGGRIDTDQIADPPSNVSWGGNSSHLYTLLMFDYDSPLRPAPVLRSFLYWLVGNIPGPDLTMGNTIVGYFPPRVHANTGIHRFLWFVYRQRNLIEFKEPKIDAKDEYRRGNFNHSGFVERYQFKSLHAFTFFECKYNKSKPKIWKY